MDRPGFMQGQSLQVLANLSKISLLNLKAAKTERRQEFPDGTAQPSESLKFVHRSVAGSENILLTAA
jgi:hypothetical protein